MMPHGDRRPLAERLQHKSLRQDDGCIVWTGQLSPGGYGTLSVGKRHRQVHRMAWEVVNGPIPKGLLVCHRCDNRRCLNVDHLFLGTHADNHADRNAKWRHTHGERHPNSKLTAEQVLAALCGSESNAALGRRYGVHRNTIQGIRAGKAWKHLAQGDAQ